MEKVPRNGIEVESPVPEEAEQGVKRKLKLVLHLVTDIKWENLQWNG